MTPPIQRGTARRLGLRPASDARLLRLVDVLGFELLQLQRQAIQQAYRGRG